MQKANHIIRQAEESDLPFIIDSWWRSHCKNIKYEKVEYIAKIKQCIALGGCLVACDISRPDVIFGWVCFGEHLSIPVIHYAYVKKAFRGFKIGKDLIESIISPKKEFFVTHDSEMLKYKVKKISFILFPEV